MTAFRRSQSQPAEQGDTRAFSGAQYDDGSMDATDIIVDAGETVQYPDTAGTLTARRENRQSRRDARAAAKTVGRADPTTRYPDSVSPETNPTRYTRAYDENYFDRDSQPITGDSGQLTTSGSLTTTGSHERVISQMHRQPRHMFLPAVIAIAVPAVVAYLYGSFEFDWQNLLLLAAGIAAVILFSLLPLLFWLSTNYTITTRRVVIRRGLLTQIRQELLHSRSYDITVRRSLIQRIFGSGDIEINAGLEQPIVLKNVPDVVLVQQVLQELMERSASSIAHRRQRGEAQHRR